MSILLNDILQFDLEEIKNIKVRFNQSSGYGDPLEEYLDNPEEVNTKYFLWRREYRVFSEGQIGICLLKLTNDTWLLTTIKRITKELGVKEGINYDAEELERYKPYYGRLIVKYKKSQAQHYLYEKIYRDLEVVQILPDKYEGDDFPGYDKVRVSYVQLESILKRNKRDWIAALENQKAVYLISDKANGKLYVGSATSENGMLLSRWKSYVMNGHGGNKELVELVNGQGFDYVKENFQYSILENYNAKVDDHVILQRESWWKEILLSRKFGYNSN